MLTTCEALTERIIGCAIEVHRNTGPGLLESVYDACMARELRAAQLKVARQVPFPIHYKGEPIECSFRIDYLIEDQVLVELKSVERTLDVHKAQVITYLKLAKLPVGLLINFNVPALRLGVRRLAMTSAAGAVATQNGPTEPDRTG